ncbi:MAG: hypothetical protein ACREMY_18790, partial [bacterium]
MSFCYDELHRVTKKDYTAHTFSPPACPISAPVVSYTYDAGANGKGHLTGLTDQAGTGSYTYDPLGRIATETRVISGVPKSLSYDYNLDGSIAKLHYPSGAVVTYTPWQNGNAIVSAPSDAKDTANNINYATGATYGADGSLAGFKSGQSASFAGYTNAFSYNKRLQPINMSASAPNQTVFSIGYDFHLGSGNNGNVYGITNYKDNSRNQSFTYDALNRLTSAQNAGTDCASMTVNGKTEYWGNSYGYDAWGNLTDKTITKCGAENLPLISNALNRADNGQAPQNGQVPSLNYQYDAAGNMIWDATENVALNYDQENRITGANGYTYTYDSDGNRVKKANGSTGTLYWYMTPGIVAESDLSGNLKSEYVFFNGERVARRDFPAGSVAYYFSDHLKT